MYSFPSSAASAHTVQCPWGHIYYLHLSFYCVCFWCHAYYTWISHVLFVFGAAYTTSTFLCASSATGGSTFCILVAFSRGVLILPGVIMSLCEIRQVGVTTVCMLRVDCVPSTTDLCRESCHCQSTSGSLTRSPFSKKH